jgi:hypothetical protein
MFLQQLENLWLVALFAVTAGVLLWFVYWVFLRRILRVMRIARIRSHRLLTEAASRDNEQNN